jgi:DNA-binding MarR family transcriptional regulator
MDALRRIVRGLRLSARDAERTAGISGAQLFVLEALSAGSTSSLNELAERTCTDQSSVSVVVSRLADRGLVARAPSASDARRIELSLTRAGKRMLDRCPKPTQARLLDAIKKLDASDLAALRGGLEAVIETIGASDEAARMFFDEDDTPKRSRKR